MINSDGGSNLENSSLYINSQDNRITLSEDSYLFKNTRKHCLLSFFHSSRLLDFFNILEEVICQVINNVSCENFDLILFSIFLSISKHLDIKDKHAGILFLAALGDFG